MGFLCKFVLCAKEKQEFMRENILELLLSLYLQMLSVSDQGCNNQSINQCTDKTVYAYAKRCER